MIPRRIKWSITKLLSLITLLENSPYKWAFRSELLYVVFTLSAMAAICRNRNPIIMETTRILPCIWTKGTKFKCKAKSIVPRARKKNKRCWCFNGIFQPRMITPQTYRHRTSIWSKSFIVKSGLNRPYFGLWGIWNHRTIISNICGILWRIQRRNCKISKQRINKSYDVPHCIIIS